MQTEPMPGAHLTTRRRGYIHHGIYAGGGRVIHYAGYGPRWRRGPVEEISLETFAGGRGWQVQSRAAVVFSGRAAVERARSRLGEDRYSVWSNNCEHFVEWVIAGTPRSPQVDAWRAPWRRPLEALALAVPRRLAPAVA